MRLHTDTVTVQPNSEKRQKKCQVKEEKRDPVGATGEEEAATVEVEEVTAEAGGEATADEGDSEEGEETGALREIVALFPSRRVRRSK